MTVKMGPIKIYCDAPGCGKSEVIGCETDIPVGWWELSLEAWATETKASWHFCDTCGKAIKITVENQYGKCRL